VKITLPRSIATLLLVGLASAMLFHWGDISEAAENDCAAAKASYEMNKRRVGEYLVALERAESRGEANLVEVLKRKIDQLLEQIVDAENPGQCERKTNVKMPSGISPAKSDETEYATKSCDELKVTLVRLLRKTSPLKRRAGSAFSDLSSAERQEYDEAARELKAVLATTRLKCGADKTAASVRQGQRRSNGRRHMPPTRQDQ
jgi:hypothetical protein